MNLLMIYLLPSILGLKLFMNFNKERKIFDLVIYYLLFVLFSNLFSMMFFEFIKTGEYNINDFSFCIRYMTIALVLNFILSLVFTIISKYFTFDIEVENERKTKRKNKSKKN